MKRRNGIISWWKFVFTLLVIMRHASDMASVNDTPPPFLRGGAIGVEFFFVTSGFLLASQVFDLEGKKIVNLISETWHFILKKIKKLYPYIIFSFCLVAISVIITKSNDIYKWIITIWDLLLVGMAGFKTFYVNDVTWYLSSMILCMFILYPILRKYGKKYSQYIAPLVIIFLGGYLSHEFGNLRKPNTWTGFILKGNLRGFLDLNCGIVGYEVCAKLKKVNFTKLGSILLALTEIALFLSVIIGIEVIGYPKSIDYLYLLILTIAITIAFSEKSVTYSFSCNKGFYFLEKVTLPMYLNQRFFIYLIDYLDIFKKYSYYEKVGILLISNFLFAIVTLYLVKILTKLFKKGLDFIKPKIILNA